jgi:hypothetical protein
MVGTEQYTQTFGFVIWDRVEIYLNVGQLAGKWRGFRFPYRLVYVVRHNQLTKGIPRCHTSLSCWIEGEHEYYVAAGIGSLTRF